MAVSERTLTAVGNGLGMAFAELRFTMPPLAPVPDVAYRSFHQRC